MHARKIARRERRRRLYEILDQGPVGDLTSWIVDKGLVLLIVVNLAAVILESVPAFEAEYRSAFIAIELASLAVFTVEYALRIWVAPEHAPCRSLAPLQARLRFVTSPAGLVDLVAILPFWLAFVLPDELRILLVFRVVRFFKIARYSPGMRSLLDALYAERRALVGCLVIFAGVTLVAAALVHLAERHAQPDKLGTLPDAIWWAVVTLGTVGYGDVVPVTGMGKLIAAITTVMAIVMIALPVGIIATAFANEIHRRDFVITWGMVARVPLFAELDAAEIADIMRLLRAQTVEPGGVVVRRGEPAQSMYFVAAGEVEIDLAPERVRLGVGHFFGEIAVLRRARRSATVTAVSRANLLILDAHDLHLMMEQSPRFAERIKEVARTRVGRELVTPQGDLVTEELEEGDIDPPRGEADSKRQ